MQSAGETWHFELAHPEADRVYLVHDIDGIASLWRQMQRDRDGRWVLTTSLAPGRHRLHYCTLKAGSVLFGGIAGLRTQRIAGDDPRVHLRPSHS